MDPIKYAALSKAVHEKRNKDILLEQMLVSIAGSFAAQVETTIDREGEHVAVEDGEYSGETYSFTLVIKFNYGRKSLLDVPIPFTLNFVGGNLIFACVQTSQSVVVPHNGTLIQTHLHPATELIDAPLNAAVDDFVAS